MVVSRFRFLRVGSRISELRVIILPGTQIFKFGSRISHCSQFCLFSDKTNTGINSLIFINYYGIMIGLNKQFNHKKLSRYCSLNGVTQSWTFFELLPRCHVLCTRPYALQSHFALPPLPQLPCETSFINGPSVAFCFLLECLLQSFFSVFVTLFNM